MKYVLLDPKTGKLVQLYVAPEISRAYRACSESDHIVRTFDNYEEALAYAKEEGNLDVAEVRVITHVRTTMHKHQTIDYCLEN